LKIWLCQAFSLPLYNWPGIRPVRQPLPGRFRTLS